MPSTTLPESARSIVIAGQAVAYQLKRSQRRTIGLAIDHRGLRVGAPTRARIGDIENLIHQHGQWVLDKLAAWRDRPSPDKLDITDGAAAGQEVFHVHLHVIPRYTGDGVELTWPRKEPGLDRLRELSARIRL